MTQPPEVPPPDDERWQTALRAVVESPDLFTLHAQPIVELSSGAIAGFELLSRFTGPWAASPDRWFAAAEKWSMNATLQARVLRTAIAARDTLPPDTFLTVNIDPHLLGEPDIAQALAEAANLARIVVELTEHTQMVDETRLTAILDGIRAAGGMIAMDDAGTGYAGLSTMLRLRPQFIKLDRELVTGLDTDPVRRALVEVLGDLAGRMDCWLLAEGIETPGELDALVTLGVPLGQGWALARPAATMLAELPPDISDHIRRTAARVSLKESVASLLRTTVTTGPAADAAEVLLDPQGRPQHVRMPGLGTWVPATVIAPSTSLPDAARRAMLRDESTRFAPLVCTDGLGAVIGIVRIDDLLTALSRSA